MHATSRLPQRAPDGAPVHYERHRPEHTTLSRLVQQHAATFIAQTEASCSQPQLLTPVLQVVQRVRTRHLLGQAGLKASEAHSGAVTLMRALWLGGEP